MDIFERDLDLNQANYQPLSPIGFLERSAMIYPDKVAIIHGERKITYREYLANAKRLASALSAKGIKKGSTVSIMATNIPAFLDANFGVPMTGATLNALNTRLDAEGIAFILDHAETDILIMDTCFSPIVKKALTLAKNKPLVIDVDDPMNTSGGERIGEIEYEDFIASGDPQYNEVHIHDEWQAIALNYTSGTTGDPKGVVYSHRGAYLTSMGNVAMWPMDEDSAYLWTLPMFHCNGWCFPWSVTARAATHVCLRQFDVETVANLMAEHNVTHFCGAAIILNAIVNAPDAVKAKIPKAIKVITGGAPPPATVLEGMDSLGFEVTHVYGLTEVYGPSVICQWKKEWNDQPAAERARLKARQGVRYVTQENVEVLDPETLESVPADGETIGEIMFRGNQTMKGYLKNPDTTANSFEGGWFHSGDLAVKHPDGYIEIKDRSKDIIISGGENISSVELEGVIYQHPAVLEAAVVAKPDDKWGETPCAFIELKPGQEATEQDIIDFCRDNIAHFKCPKTVIFGALPKTSTGKIQKFLLRERAKA
ncbi:O-succinylbenzoate--CoA ligase [Alteromonas macleodii]|jgi:fatty-acyl-CoA synthase|uniref:acyl-CoA synthetase n=1 Tax=Alteromonas TaxID=226 RepID=UPI00090406C8|nr:MULTISPECIES: acyl-CoA synthetase [Alteromonas]APE04965.1 acyl-CoA synthetase [Alteromonas sp. RW2A1]QPL48992.1 acyl-CoA synthetase [Alteromonas sp. B31-7]|tara:strand:- start:22257 stop:23876 length:1620 start_codon:yes stop_codon:yes gene_type:complete